MATVHVADLAQLSFLRPTTDGDRHPHPLAASVLAALWPTFATAGARRLILCGHITRPSDAELYHRAIPAPQLTVCLLTAGFDTLTARALQRGHGNATPLPGDELLGLPETRLRQIDAAAAQHAKNVRRSGVADIVVETDDRPVRDVAGDAGSLPGTRRHDRVRGTAEDTNRTISRAPNQRCRVGQKVCRGR